MSTVADTNTPQLETLKIDLAGKVATVTLNRPDKANAMNWAMWQDIRSAMQWADRTPEARVVVLQGEGKHFTSGIDLQMMMGLQAQIKDDCDGRSREKLRQLVLEFSARVGDRSLKGIDMIAFDEQGRIVDFEVMVRPFNGLQALGAEMGARLAAFLPAYKG